MFTTVSSLRSSRVAYSFDLNLPLEVDDEYWTGPNAWTQPEGVPSTITGFNHFLRLTQIMAFTVKTVVSHVTSTT